MLSCAICVSVRFGGVTVPRFACAAALPLMVLGAFLGNRIHAHLEQIKFWRLVAMILHASGMPPVLH